MNNCVEQMNSFLDGMRDCKNGVPHKSGKGQDYDRGYNVQHELEQMKTEATRHAS